MLSLESPHRGDSNVYTQYTIFIIKKKIIPDYSKSAAMGFFLGTQERARNSRGKRAISGSIVYINTFIQYRIRKQAQCSLIYVLYISISVISGTLWRRRGSGGNTERLYAMESRLRCERFLPLRLELETARSVGQNLTY